MSDEIRIAPGANFEIAAFRWWHPPECASLKAVLVLVPGSNGDGRGEIERPFWRDFCRLHHLALVGCHLTDPPHENMQIEAYARAGDGSGQALLDAIQSLAQRSGHPELAEAPLLLWGHSAGGQFNYEFACWKASRVKAFVVNKGGYYYTHLAPPATRALAGLFVIGAKDEAFRIQSIQGIYAVNAKAGAAWDLKVEPEAGHELGRSPEYARDFFSGVLAGRT